MTKRPLEQQLMDDLSRKGSKQFITEVASTFRALQSKLADKHDGTVNAAAATKEAAPSPIVPGRDAHGRRIRE